MIPHEREMVERLKEQPFALVSNRERLPISHERIKLCHGRETITNPGNSRKMLIKSGN